MFQICHSFVAEPTGSQLQCRPRKSTEILRRVTNRIPTIELQLNSKFEFPRNSAEISFSSRHGPIRNTFSRSRLPHHTRHSYNTQHVQPVLGSSQEIYSPHQLLSLLGNCSNSSSVVLLEGTKKLLHKTHHWTDRSNVSKFKIRSLSVVHSM